MRVRFTRRARAQLRAIFLYVRDFNPRAAEDLVDTIEALADELAEFPDLGRPFDSKGRRVLTLPDAPYRIVYRLASNEVRVPMVRHTSRRPLRSHS
jgi:toxin ParE1/3/4